MTSTDNAMIQAVQLSKRYEDGVLALDNLNLQVQAGEIYGMLGGNGAGKTTAIHLFLNFIEPTSGEAQIAGISSHREPLEAKKHVAFVSENVSLYPNFTAIQNLEYFTRLGGRKDVTRKDYEAVLKLLQVELLARKRALPDDDPDREVIDRVLGTTVSGIALGLRNTG